MRWLVAILITMPLAGFIGENRDVAHAKCEMDLIKLRGGQLPPTHPYTNDEQVFIANCMRSHGYRYSQLLTGCNPTSDGQYYYTVPDCYEPFSMENKLRARIER
jgi:hypothetical protein